MLLTIYNQLKELIATLPYELTNAQKRVVNEICKDLKEPHRMNRLFKEMWIGENSGCSN